MYKLIAHRGDHQTFKENSLAAFYEAINNDYEGFECDIRQTKDRKLVIYHDPLFKGKLVRNLNYSELKEEGIIELKDVLQIKTNKIIMLDIKDSLLDTDLLKKKLDQYPHQNIYIITFHNHILKKLFQKDRKYKIGILNYYLNTEDEHYQYDFFCILNLLLDSDVINKFMQAQKELIVYGVNKKDLQDVYPYYIVE